MTSQAIKSCHKSRLHSLSNTVHEYFLRVVQRMQYNQFQFWYKLWGFAKTVTYIRTGYHNNDCYIISTNVLTRLARKTTIKNKTQPITMSTIVL